MLAFGYRFLGRSVEDANLEIEDLTSINGGLLVWLPEDKTHDEEQNLVLLDRPDIQLVPRLTRWLDYMADQGITTGPVFRHVLRSGKVASAETQGKTAMARGGERAVRQDSRAQPRCGVGLTRHPGALGCRLGSCGEARTDSRTACRVLREMPGLEPLGVPVVFLDVVAWPDVRPSRLAHGERVLGEPTGHADLTHSRLSLAAARDADDHLAGKTPYLVLGDPNGLSACWVEACEGAGLIQCSAVGDGRDRHACKVAVIR
ncbi:hypothetical protein OHB10_46210 [Streptomyces sp. NBC_01597]|uniref:hypothetical protein n=1 Tax=Streptomyces sp. NBC_01597 TaxID=2975891 RepID=UPI0038698369